MSAYLMLLAAIAVLLAICAALIYRNNAQSAQHKRELQNTIVEAMAATVSHRKKLDDDLAVVGEKHREETVIERQHLADRRDFDNDWGGLPVELTGNNAADRGAAAAEPAGTAGD